MIDDYEEHDDTLVVFTSDFSCTPAGTRERAALLPKATSTKRRCFSFSSQKQWQQTVMEGCL
jgi:hypothetical protein